MTLTPQSRFTSLLTGYLAAMPPPKVVKAGHHSHDQPRQQSFDELAAARVSDEASADAVIAEVLAQGSLPEWKNDLEPVPTTWTVSQGIAGAHGRRPG